MREFSFLECETTASSRLDQVSFLNEDTSECVSLKNFYEIQQNINSKLLVEIKIDNLKLFNDQKFFNQNFAEFFEQVLAKSADLYKKKDLDLITIKSLSYSIKNILFDVALRNHFKDNSQKIVTYAAELIEIDKSSESLSYLILKEFIKDKTQFTELLLTVDDTFNCQIQKLLTSSVLSEFSKSQGIAIEFLENLLNLIPVDVSKSWMRMSSYLDLIYSLTCSDNELLIDYLFSKELVYKLIDFFLNKESPFGIKDGRHEIGSKTLNAKFHSLVQSVSNLVTRTYPPFYYKESRNEFEDKIKQDSLEIILPHSQWQLRRSKSKYYILTERELEAVNLKSFYIKAQNYPSSELSYLYSHLMFNDLEFTKKKLYILLEFFNDTINHEKLKGCFEIAQEILCLKDNFSIIRREWLLGIPQIDIKYSSQNSIPLLINFNLSSPDKQIKFISNILYNTTSDPLLERVVHRYQNSSDFIIILKYFLEFIFKDNDAIKYCFYSPYSKLKLSTVKSNEIDNNLTFFDYLFNLGKDEIHRIENMYSMKEQYSVAISYFIEAFNKYNLLKNTYPIDNYTTSKLYNQNEEQLLYVSYDKLGSIVSDRITLLEKKLKGCEGIYLLQVDYFVDPEFKNDTNQTKQEKQEVPPGVNSNEVEQQCQVINLIDPAKQVCIDVDEVAVDLTGEVKLDLEAGPKKKIDDDDEDDDFTYIKEYNDKEEAKIVNLPIKKKNQSEERDYNSDDLQPNKDEGFINLAANLNDQINKIKRSNSGEKRKPIFNVTSIDQTNMKHFNDYKESENSSTKGVKNNQNNTQYRVHINHVGDNANNIVYYNSFNEEDYIKKNIEVIENFGFLERSIYPSNKSLNLIRKFIVYNSTKKETRIKFKFECEGQTNTYILASQVVIDTKEFGISQIHTFTSANLDNIKSIGYSIVLSKEEKEEINNNILKEEILALPSAEGVDVTQLGPIYGPHKTEETTQANQQNEGFVIVCNFCNHTNTITEYSNYDCQSCKRNLFM